MCVRVCVEVVRGKLSRLCVTVQPLQLEFFIPDNLESQAFHSVQSDIFLTLKSI